MIAAIYARLYTKDVDRALQAQADRWCSLVAEKIEVLPAGAGTHRDTISEDRGRSTEDPKKNRRTQQDDRG